ncbi:MAG: dihydrofolate reductase family protein [Leptospiraceae bacterium]
MRKLTVIEFISLDGIIQAPGGPDEDTSGEFKYGGWVVPYFGEETLEAAMEDQMSLQQCELLLGRRTYEIFASYWPQNADSWPGINEVRKFVASENPALELEWQNSVLLGGNVAERIEKLKSDDGPDLHLWGSGNLVQTLLKHDLVDRLWLKIFPIILGQGKRLFADGIASTKFTLTSSTVSPRGVIIASYDRAGAVQTGSFIE